MNGIIFDLKSFRANQLDGISQEKFAKQVGISQDRVSRMEADPSQVTLEVLCKISAHFGISLDQLVGNPKPVVEPLVVCDTWSAADYKRRMFLEYLSDNCIDEKYLSAH